MKRIRALTAVSLALILALTALAAGCAEEEAIAAIVNGERIPQTEVDAQAQYYLALCQQGGMDPSDEAVIAFVANQALTAVIDDHLITQDMTAMGAYDFTQEEQAALAERAGSSYASVVTQLAASAPDPSLSEDDLLAYGQQLAAQYGYTPEYFTQYYQNDLASQKYADALMAGEAIADDEVQAAYDQRVADSRDRYAQDVPAFEAALGTNEEVWFVPEGYRRVLQIFLRSDAEDKLADTADRVAEIYARLDAGEDFAALIGIYGEDDALADAAALETGYLVHRDSVVWEDAFVAAAFAPELAAPGDYAAQPLAGSDGVHILYYLGDREGGPVPLTDELREALRDTLYSQRANEKVMARLEELEAAAQVELPDRTQEP